MVAEDETPVLVAVVTNPVDLQRALHEQWYRIPVASAPRPLAAQLLALYQTGTFGAEGHAIRYLLPICGWQVLRRRALLPDEHAHPRAEALYYRLSLGPAELLPHPLPSKQLRRITFIPTTLGRLRAAADVRELWMGREALERLCRQLRAEGFNVARRRLREPGRAYDSIGRRRGLALLYGRHTLLLGYEEAELVWDPAGCLRRALLLAAEQRQHGAAWGELPRQSH